MKRRCALTILVLIALATPALADRSIACDRLGVDAGNLVKAAYAAHWQRRFSSAADSFLKVGNLYERAAGQCTDHVSPEHDRYLNEAKKNYRLASTDLTTHLSTASDKITVIRRGLDIEQRIEKICQTSWQEQCNPDGPRVRELWRRALEFYSPLPR